jgi:hypothetical protein
MRIIHHLGVDVSSILMPMKEKSLSGVESVHNQLRDTAAGLAIHRIELNNDNRYLVFGVFFGLTS